LGPVASKLTITPLRMTSWGNSMLSSRICICLFSLDHPAASNSSSGLVQSVLACISLLLCHCFWLVCLLTVPRQSKSMPSTVFVVVTMYSYPLVVALGTLCGESSECSRWEQGEGRVSGTLKPEYLAKGTKMLTENQG
jgi:hypothetical protein